MAVHWETPEPLEKAAGAAFGHDCDEVDNDPRLGRRLKLWWVLAMLGFVLYVVALRAC